jgi:hypothetical protein
MPEQEASEQEAPEPTARAANEIMHEASSSLFEEKGGEEEGAEQPRVIYRLFLFFS